MDPMLQRLMIAQELVQGLVNLLSLPLRPPHNTIQAVLDAAAAKVKALNDQQEPPQAPLVVPSLVPPGGTP